MTDQDDNEIDRIMDLVNDMCWTCHHTGNWTPIDNLLRAVSIEDTKIVHLITWLMETAAAKTKLHYRAEFYEKVYAKAVAEGRENPDRLLDGLK